MHTPLNASAQSAGALLSSATFDIPQFQREYSWGTDEVTEMWKDFQSSIISDSYFLGLIILTDEGGRKHVVDGQQRLITLSLLAAAIYREAIRRERKALGDRIWADFLHFTDYKTDEVATRIRLSDQADNQTFQSLITLGQTPEKSAHPESVSQRMIQSYEFLSEKLKEDLAVDPFKRLGQWAEFLTTKIYFAVFVHPDPSSAYQVYEVINTRGKNLTTADLLKSYVLSQTPPGERETRYLQWQEIARHFPTDGANNFVQYIRHVVTVRSGHILPRDLFGFLASRTKFSGKAPPTSHELVNLLSNNLSLYNQMIDPTLAGPAHEEATRVFSALNSLGVIAVRPILLAMADLPDHLDGMKYILRLVVRRIIVGNLGTGNVERRLSEAAKTIYDKRSWKPIVDDLRDLNPSQEEFIYQLRKRSFNKQTLQFMRRSIIQNSITPNPRGILHFMWTRQAPWAEMGEEEGYYWASKVANTLLSELDRRPKTVKDWGSFKSDFLPSAIEREWVDRLAMIDEWNSPAVDDLSNELAEAAGAIWFE